MGEPAPADICNRLPGVYAEGFFRQCLSIFSEACRRNGEAQQPAGDTDGAYYTQQMDELHKTQAAEYLAEGEVFDESRKEELLSKMAAGGELTEQEKGLVNIFASAQEIDSATASAKLQADIGEEIFRQMGQSGISPIPSFEISIGIDGKAEVKGIEDAAVKEKVEDILNGFSGELMDTYISINAGMQGMNKQEQYILKAAKEIEAFLQKATDGKVALSDITVENGRIKGLDVPPLTGCLMIRDRTRHTLITERTYLQSRIMKVWRGMVCWKHSTQNMLLMERQSVQLESS